MASRVMAVLFWLNLLIVMWTVYLDRPRDNSLDPWMLFISAVLALVASLVVIGSTPTKKRP